MAAMTVPSSPQLPRTLVRFAVISDSHFHLDGMDPQACYPSDARHNDQNRVVVEWLNRAEPAFVIHAGDVPHPVPGTEAHHGALQIARSTYDALKAPLTVVPGNHDVGDKPQGWATAPHADAGRHQLFEHTWGAPWGSFDHGPVHVLWLDTPILGTGLDLEADQKQWLEQDLKQAQRLGQRIFAFVHYPPFLCTPDEPEHYDNLAEPGRSWVLDVLADHGVEALFCGHVHHFFWNQYRDMDIYVLPATSFVRPEYSELCTVEPGRENGRDDIEKLGFFFVHVLEEGHRIEPVRTDGATQPGPPKHPLLAPGKAAPADSLLGVTLRHDWMRPRGIPCANLDEFRRKLARNDLPLCALWEAGISRLRVPAGDLCQPETRGRLLQLVQKGMRLVVFSAGATAEAHTEVVAAHKDHIEAWEIVTRDGDIPIDSTVRSAGVSILTSTLEKASTGTYFSHFPPHGFSPDHPELAHRASRANGFVGRIADGRSIWESTQALAQQARAQGSEVLAHVELPRAGESARHTDDLATARCVAESCLAAIAHPEIGLLLDTFVDHDRGYYPRNGLLDRRGGARPALLVLVHLQRLVPDGPITRREDGAFDTPGGTVWLQGAPAGTWIDLVTGVQGEGTPTGPVFVPA